MRAPIGFRISSRRKNLGISQAALARTVGISPSYLNLIENNKRDVGGALLIRIAQQLSISLDELEGKAEQKLLHELEESFADPLLESVSFRPDERRELVAQYPASATALARLYRAYGDVQSQAEAYADRLRSDPLLSQLLHQILSGVTAIRSSAEILQDVEELDDTERARFVATIGRESLTLTEVARTLIGQFESTSQERRSVSPAREIDDLLLDANNYFELLETAADNLRSELAEYGPFGPAAMVTALDAGFGVQTLVGARPREFPPDYPGQYRYDPASRTVWFAGTTTLATRQFQLARLYGELAGSDAIATSLSAAVLSTPLARRLATRAMGSYLAGAIVFPYARFLADADAHAYDIDQLRQLYSASFEQVAHRLVTLRKPGQEGVPFGFLRSDPAGRLTKHFPLPGLLLPKSGHACPLWAVYMAFRQPDVLQRQVVRFSDGSRYLFLARTVQRRTASFREAAVPVSIMLACDALHADRTIYGAGLDLTNSAADVPVGPSCRLCTRHDCPDRQEEAPPPSGRNRETRGPLVPQEFGLGGSS
ncbi:helix-turn-helix domain-containing protein [Devosia sp. RR2S18]|uniref:helix-turn-helix domain-containing protein n=1 Tax=Devosia rhizosphaerae TaxID=3049774 RepID=UPI0025413DD9|nr:short-chain fatty acyl-CoA regulator family protein [Devosia sp. RR2S18]WIJ23697.1 short-chain fatty acyl-CoA regulator family protein [Devosia sp. RR2S18]